MNAPKPPKALDTIADVVLAYRPKPKTKPAKLRKRRATKPKRNNCHMATEWRRIDTAPKDGTVVLGCHGDDGDDYSVFEMMWDGSYGWRDPKWDGGYNPTHWTPRPAPPKDSRS